MKRRESRELAFVLLFERTFREEEIEEIIHNATEADDVKVSDKVKSVGDVIIIETK